MSELKFGERIRMVRKEAKCKQKDFCKLLDIPQSTLSAYETDRMQPTITTLVKVAETFNVSLDWLCGLNKPSIASSNFNAEMSLDDVLQIIFKAAEIRGMSVEIHLKDRQK